MARKQAPILKVRFWEELNAEERGTLHALFVMSKDRLIEDFCDDRRIDKSTVLYQLQSLYREERNIRIVSGGTLQASHEVAFDTTMTTMIYTEHTIQKSLKSIMELLDEATKSKQAIPKDLFSQYSRIIRGLGADELRNFVHVTCKPRSGQSTSTGSSNVQTIEPIEVPTDESIEKARKGGNYSLAMRLTAKKAIQEKLINSKEVQKIEEAQDDGLGEEPETGGNYQGR